MSVKRQKGRTIILNDVFDKKLLKHKLNRAELKSLAESIPGSNTWYVIPSHHAVKDIFPHSKTVLLDLPDNDEDRRNLLDHLKKDFWSYQTNDIRELVGEIECKLEHYGMFADNANIAKILSMCNSQTTFGDIQCLVQNLEPTDINKSATFERFAENYNWKHDLTNQYIDVVVPYKEIKSIDTNKIIDQLIDQ